jgi:signal peptidase II
VQERRAGTPLRERPGGEGAVGPSPVTPIRHRVRLAGVAAAVLLADQLTKWWALEALDDRTVDLVWTLRLRLVFNRGSAFGLGSRFGPVIAILAVVVVVLLLRSARGGEGRLGSVALGLVLGGALGNLADRVFREGRGLLGGSVVDFVDLQWWPVFNLADAAIVVGAGLLVFGSRGHGP